MTCWLWALFLAFFLFQDDTVAGVATLMGCPEPLYECPSKNITFQLYVPGKPPQAVDESNAGSVRLYGMGLKVLVHDFDGGINDTSSKALRKAYLQRGGLALLSVDWSPLASQRCGRAYAEAQAGLVGACTARLLAAGAASGALPPPQRLHALGVGLGAHVAALAAACMPGGHIGRLTALDPTPAPPSHMPLSPGADTPASAPLLDADAALQVDVLHTTGLVVGASSVGDPRPAGHVDVYVGCGQRMQPFCKRTKDPGLCSHQLAATYFAESVWPGPGLRASPCSDDCRRNLSLPELGPAFSSRLTTTHVPVGEDLPFTASGILCADAAPRPPFGRHRHGAGGDYGGGGSLCWVLSAVSLIYLGARAVVRRTAEH